MFKEHDIVKLTRDVPSHSLNIGALATVLAVLPDSFENEYEIEPADAILEPALPTERWTITVPESALDLASTADIMKYSDRMNRKHDDSLLQFVSDDFAARGQMRIHSSPPPPRQSSVIPDKNHNPASPISHSQVPPPRHAPSSAPQAVPGWAPPRPSPRITVESVLAAGILGALLLGVSGCMVLFVARIKMDPHGLLAGAPFAQAYFNPGWVIGFLAGITFRLLARADESIRVLLIIVTLIGTVIYISQSVAP